MAFIAGTIAVVAFVCLYRIRKQQLSDLQRYEHHMNEFHDNVKPLIEDKDTPTEVLEIIRFFNNEIIDKSAAPVLLKHVSGGRFNAFATDANSQRRYKPVREFFAKRPELEEPFNRAAASALIAINACGQSAVKTSQ